ncbi:hypothetical protein PQX77_012219 [Marasmius sp. AFHP31]|nr:hypothetical protein PQX77_012219 [Marasmius sp. AFHP31]
MPFDSSCTHPRLVHSTLHVTHKGHNISLDLDKGLGNKNGTFKWEGHGFSKTSQNLCLQGSVLTAELRMDDQKTWKSATIDLSQVVHLVDGKLVFIFNHKLKAAAPVLPVMHFAGSCTHTRLEHFTLHVTHKGHDLSLDLDKCLGNENGVFRWGGHGFSNTSRSLSLEGSVLTGELQMNDQKTWTRTNVDLSQEIHVVDDKLVFNHLLSPRERMPTPPLTPGTPPPAYQESFSERLRSYKSTHKSSMTTTTTSGTYSYEERSSAYMKFSVDNLHLSGSVLSGRCLQSNGKYENISFDLKDHIGVVAGQLIWGRKGFMSDCQPCSICLQKDSPWVLEAQCYYRDHSHDAKAMRKSTLDLSRYLHVFKGKFELKVIESSHELSEMFSEAKWMKFKVVTEPNPEFLLDMSTFRASFRQIAESAVKHVVTEVTEEFKEMSAKHIRTVLKGDIEQEVTRTVTEVVTTQVKNLVEVEVERVFAAAKKEVFKGKFELKVIESSHELSEMFSEAKWMKFKVVTEPNPEFLLDMSTFRASFRQIAESAVKHVVTEVTEEFKEMSAKHIRTVLKGDIEQEVTRTVTEVVTTQVKNLVEVEVERVFAAAKKEVIKACHKMQETAIREITASYTNKVTQNMVTDLSRCVDTLIMQSMTEVSALAVAQFQQHAEILMERELSLATMRSAKTQANFLKSLAAQMESSAGIESKANGHCC